MKLEIFSIVTIKLSVPPCFYNYTKRLILFSWVPAAEWGVCVAESGSSARQGVVF